MDIISNDIPTGHPPPSSMVDYKDTFGAPEYAVFASVLLLSAAIGIYHAFFGPKQNTTDEYLLGGRQMSVLPVALSLLCSFVSAITLLGNPVEVYFYGSQYWLISLSFIPMTALVVFLYVPVFFELSLTSSNEYFQLRFNSQLIRTTVSIISIVYLIIYMSITVYGPSLALSQVAGINKYLSTGTIFVVCIFYSSLGGLKAVLWTDALQAVVMLVSLIVVVAKGVSDVGGMGEVWNRADNTSRIEFLNFDPDPRTRHTVWTEVVGGCLAWLPLYAGTQSQIQRYCSVPTLQKAELALVINMFGLMTITTLCFLSGMVIYAIFYQCDPLGSGQIESNDQLLPLLVMVTLSDYPGLPGFFVAGLTCASLSSVSSGLNALSAILTEDYVRKWKPETRDSRMAFYSKIITFGCGILSFGGTFLASLLGNIFQAGLTLVGTLLGPTVGIFSLGMFFPFANEVGSFLGLMTGTILMLLLGVGSIIAGDRGDLPDQKLPLTTAGCYGLEPNATFTSSSAIFAAEFWKDRDDSTLIKILSISYVWYPGIGCLSTVFFGVIFSLMSYKSNSTLVKPICMSKPALRFWKRILPTNYFNSLINFDEKIVKTSLNIDGDLKNEKEKA